MIMSKINENIILKNKNKRSIYIVEVTTKNSCNA